MKKVKIEDKRRHASEKLIEEMAELIKELVKFDVDSPKKDINHLVEEVAHVELWLDIIKKFYKIGFSDLFPYKHDKTHDKYFKQVLKELGIKINNV